MTSRVTTEVATTVSRKPGRESAQCGPSDENVLVYEFCFLPALSSTTSISRLPRNSTRTRKASETSSISTVLMTIATPRTSMTTSSTSRTARTVSPRKTLKSSKRRSCSQPCTCGATDSSRIARRASSKPLAGKAAKRAARAAAYNSDDEDAEEDPNAPLAAGLDFLNRAEPEPIEGQVDATMEELEAAGSEDDEDEDDEDEAGNLRAGQLEDLRQVEKRMRTAARVLKHWKELGPQAGMYVSHCPA